MCAVRLFRVRLDVHMCFVGSHVLRVCLCAMVNVGILCSNGRSRESNENSAAASSKDRAGLVDNGNDQSEELGMSQSFSHFQAAFGAQPIQHSQGNKTIGAD